MKAISLQPPWGILICLNMKDCENRSWRSNFAGEVLIHQSKRWDIGAMDTIRKVDPNAWQYLLNHYEQAHAYGIIGKATFGQCRDFLPSKWFFGKYAYPCSNGTLFEKPIMCKGALNFFDVAPEILQAVK